MMRSRISARLAIIFPPPVVDVKLPDGDFGCLLLKMTCRKINRETVRQKSQRTTIRME